MSLYMLLMKAEIEGVASIHLKTSENLCIDVANPLSDFEKREKVVFHPTNPLEHEEKESERHFELSWEGIKKRSILTVLTEGKIKTALKKKKGVDLPREYKSEDSGQYVAIFAVQCRGLKPTAFHPMGNEFQVISEGGVEFDEDVDLSEGDWADYDADNDQPVSISDVDFKWEAV